MRFRPSPSMRLLAAGALLTALAVAGGCGSGSGPIQQKQNPVPTIANLSPSSASAGTAAQTLTINGTNFVSTAGATYNDAVHAVTYLSSTQLQIQLASSDLASAGSFPVVVTNPSPGGGASNAATFSVNNPVPTISTLSPPSATAGSAAQTLTINGTNFMATSGATYNNVVHTVTFGSANQLQIQLTPGDLAIVGNYPVVVTNPSPGGGASNPVNFVVDASGPGSLTVNISGVPSGQTGSVMVAGPNGFSQTLTQTTTLTALTPGTYTISAAILPSSSNANLIYVPVVSGSPAAVKANVTVTASATFTGLSTIWQPVGPQAIAGAFGSGLPAAGKLNAFAVNNANSLQMYAGGGAGGGGPGSEAGIYKTVDGGRTWAQANVGLTDPSVNALWLDPSHPSTVLAGTTFAGIFRSADAGSTWNLVAPLGQTFAFLQRDSTLYAATLYGLAQSTDDGATWVLGSNTQPAASLAGNGQTIYEGQVNGDVLVQTSPSGPWTTTSFGGVNAAASIAVNTANSQNAVVADFQGYQSTPDIYVTSNGGSTWPAANLSNCAVQAVGPDWTGGTFYAGCDFVLLQSVDSGVDWSTINTLYVDVRSITPTTTSSPGHFVVGSDQGLYLTGDAGATWQSLNGNITSSLLYSVAVDGSTILTVAQDFGPLYSFDGGSTWQWLTSGNENGVASFNPANSQYAYLYTYAGFEVSTDGGHSFASVPNIPAGASEPAVDLQVPSTLYVPSSSGVYKSLDWGVTWTAQSWPVASPQMLAVDPSNSKTLFAIAFPNPGGLPGVMFTHDGGATWMTASLGAACGYPFWVAVDPTNSLVVLAGMVGNDSCGGGILKSTDGGATFAPSSAGLNTTQNGCQDQTVSRLRFDPSGSGIIAATTACALYLSSDLGNNWTNIHGNAVPNTFTDLNWSGGNLYAATFGEGVLRMPFPF